MQGFVTRATGNLDLKKVFLKIFSIALIAIFSSILIVQVSKNKKDKIFLKKTYYFVCVDESSKVSALEKSKVETKKLGGAGIVFENDSKFFLAVNVYKRQNDAVLVKDDIGGEKFSPSVIELKTSTLKQAQKQKIKANERVFKFVNVFDEFVDEILDDELNVLAGKLSDSEFSKKIIKKKLEFETMNDNFDSNNELENNAKVVINLCLTHLDNFLRDYFDTLNKSHILSLMCTSIVLVRVDLFNNL